ncbi:uncharacterized protein AB675_11781 [Cyphellophora attinorum]|uniref:Uncharacterized protein n=1 Tax=Cyphellophora attinorum TaxID=1664694 RepID=A0A0N1HJU4_9EURO|nr:uncharacterized protein AB675_11781 [Phialophora attinorum]KPI36856.1 hypothetical protein AB675_11781 [Phialophora attinorum]
MSGIVSAPSWDKPEPTLTGMPLEILENIIGFALPMELKISAYYGITSREEDYFLELLKPLNWRQLTSSGVLYESWNPMSILLVSKTIRKTGRKILSQRHIEFMFVRLMEEPVLDDDEYYRNFYPMKAGIVKKVEEHVKRIITKKED